MNKLLTKIASLFFGMGLAIGVGAAIGSGKKALESKATTGDRTAATAIESGEKYLVTAVYSNERYYLTPDTKALSAGNVKATKIADVANATEDICWTFTGSGTSWALSANGFYLANTNTNNGVLTQSASQNWTSSFDGSTLKLTGVNSRYLALYQGSNWRCYSSSSGVQSLQIYKLEAASVIVDVESVSLNKSSLDLEVGQEETLTATVLPANATNKNVSWSSGDEAVATVDDGKVTAVGAGETTITVTTEDGGKTATCDVTVTKSPYTIDLLNKAATGNPSNYADWSGVEGNSGAVYAGNSSGGNSSIQLRLSSGDQAKSGIVTTKSGGAIKKAVVVWNSNTQSGRTLNVYGKNAAYESAADLYDSEKAGTLIGTIVYGTSTELVIDGTYKYVGLVSNSGAMYLTSVSLYWGEAPTDPSVSLDKTEVTLKTNKLEGVTVKATVENVEEPTYSWTTEATNITLENANTDTVTIKPNTSVAGVAVVNLTVGGVAPALTAHVDVAISIPGPGETPENPYTVAQARAAIDADEGITGVYAKGIVSEIVTEFNPTYGNISYNISADGKTTSDQLQAYRGKSFDGEWFTSADDIKVGDEVIVVGNLKKYNSTTYEFDTDNQLVVRNRISITLTPNEVLLDENEDGNIVDLFSDISITQRSFDNYTISDIVWASDDEDVLAIVDDAYIAGEAGSAKLTASLGGKEYAEVSVTVRKAEDPLTAINFTNAGDDLEVERNGNFQLTWALTPTHPTDGEGVKFSISDADAGSEISVTQEGLISAGSVPGVSAIVKIESDHNEDIYDEVMVTVVMDEMYITVGESVFEKVTSTEELTDGEYLIVNEENEVAFNGGLDPLDAVGNKLGVVIGDGVIDGTDELLNATFTYNKTDKTLKSKSGYYMGRNSNSNGMDTSKTDKNTNTITFEENGDANIKGSGGAYLRYNSASNQIRFRYYKSDSYTGQKAVQLYKLSASDKILVGADLYNAVVAFNKEFKCDASGETFDQEAWELASVAFDNIDLTAYKLKDAIANKTGNLVEQFLARYDYAVGKYSAEISDLDFLAREPAPVPSGSYMPLGSNAKSNAAATVIIIIAVLGVTAFGVYFLLRKRKEER